MDARPFDLSYTHATCDKCKRSIQLMDWNGALHHLTCPAVDVPKAEQDRITTLAADNGVKVSFGRIL